MLLATKLFMPRRLPQVVARPRLLQKLQTTPTGKLLLVSAPAGFGKTTLVTEWIVAQAEYSMAKPQFCWLSLDENDNDPMRFLAYLVAAIQGIEPTLGQSILAMLAAPQPPKLDLLITLLINELVAIQQPFTLVLDDYHVLTAKPIHEALTFLIDQMPPAMKLVITTRADPPLPLARWRVRRVMTEIRASDLRFTVAEAAEFLHHALGTSLTDEVVQALETHTEGWIAGLQLAALSMQERKDVNTFVRHFTGSNVFIIDYLAEEVLQKLPDTTRLFLLQTAILERFCAPLCQALTGRNNAQLLLEELQRANLFLIPLDEQRNWFRYHHLFAEVLKNHLQRHDGANIAHLHRRAALWYAEQALPTEAIHHAFAAQDLPLAADLIEQSLDQFTSRGEQATIAAWLEKLPRDLCFARPRLALAHGNILVIRHDLAAAREWLQRLVTAFDTGNADAHLWGELRYQQANAATRTFDFEAAISHCEQGLAVVSTTDWSLRAKLLLILGLAYYYVRGVKASLNTFQEATQLALKAHNLYIALYGLNNQAEALAKLGQLRQAITTFQQGLQLAQEHALDHLAVTNRLHDGLSLVLYEVNELDAMQVHVDQALARRQFLNPVQHFEVQVALAKLQYGRGHPQMALTTIEEALAAFAQQKLPMENTTFACHLRVDLWLSLGRRTEASAWAATSGLGIDDELTMTQQMEYIALTRVLVAEEKYKEAFHLLDRLLQAAQADEQESTQVALLAIQALALAAAGELHAAQESLAAAIHRGAKGGFVRSFVILGEPMQRLLMAYRQTLSRSANAGQALALSIYLDHLLAAFPTTAQATDEQTAPPEITQAPSLFSASTHQPATEVLIEPLSVREREVLQLVAAGLSNNQIADQLVVTVGTVKRHLNNIYGKLGVVSRTQALVRARSLQLL